MNTSVSVIIPTLNAEPYLEKLLRSLREQTILCEILVVDSSSSDNTLSIAEASGVKAKVINRMDFDHGETRSNSATEAHNDILVFMTQDALPANSRSVENLILPLADDKIGATYGRQLPAPEADPFAAHTRLFMYGDKSFVKSLADKKRYGIHTPFLSNSFAAYRKKALQEVGLFKKGIIFGEDAQAAAKLLLAGYQLAYAADAQVYHSHNYSMIQEYKRYFDTGIFYESEDWLLKTFGRTGTEGGRFIKSELLYLLKQHHYGLLLQFLPRNALRYAGFILGRHYPLLPRTLCKKMSINPTWWDKDSQSGPISD